MDESIPAIVPGIRLALKKAQTNLPVLDAGIPDVVAVQNQSVVVPIVLLLVAAAVAEVVAAEHRAGAPVAVRM